MQDLLLWRLLRAPTLKPSLLTPLLRELAALSVEERFPFLGLLPRALRHADADLREAAVLVLRDATGPHALHHLVAALDDPVPAVRRAAVAALRTAVAPDPPRWAHALFHPDAEVRVAAVGGANPFGPDWRLLHLLPDPACAPHVLPRLEGQYPPARALPQIIDLEATGHLPRPLARRLAAVVPSPDLVFWLNNGRMRSEEHVGRLLDVAERPSGGELLRTDPSQDEWDGLVALFWDAEGPEAAAGPAPGTPSLPEEILQATAGAGALAGQRTRILGALLVQAAHRGLAGTWGAQTCAAFHPPIVTLPWLPQAARREAVRGLYRLGERCPSRPADEVRRLLGADICQRPSGNFDLWVVGGLLHLLPGEPYKRLQEWVGTDRVLASCLEDMEGSAPFLSLHDNSDRGRRFLIRALCQQDLAGRARLLARLIKVVSADALDFLDPLDGRAACGVFEELLELGPEMSARKARRVGEVLGRKIAAGQVGPFLRAWLQTPAPEEIELGLQVLRVVARTLEARPLLQTALALGQEGLRRFLTVTAWCAGFPYEKEAELARGLAAHPDEPVRAWAQRRLPVLPAPARTPPGKKGGRVAAAVAAEIAGCPAGDLAGALSSGGFGLKVGLCEGLARRPEPATPNLTVCAALLAAHDPPLAVVEQFCRFGSQDAEFVEALDQDMATSWSGETQLPLLGHAWLYRWEEHARAAIERLGEWPGGLLAGLHAALTFPAAVLGSRIWLALERLVGVWRWYERKPLVELCSDSFGALLVEALVSRVADEAARVVQALREATPEFAESLRLPILKRLPDVPATSRALLHPWIDARGLAAPPAPPPAAASAGPSPELLERAWSGADPAELEKLCRSDWPEVAGLAAGRLCQRGTTGAETVAGLLRETPPLPGAARLAWALADYPRLAEIREAWDCLADPEAPPEARFRIGLALFPRHKPKVRPHLLDALCCETPVPWVRAEDRDALLAAGFPARQLAIGLAASPQPHAYTWAVGYLLETPLTSSVRHALAAFLECGTARTRELRLRAAEKLRWTNEEVLPLLLQQEVRAYPRRNDLFTRLAPELIEAIVSAVLTVGPAVFPEENLLEYLANPSIDPDGREAAYRRLLLDAANNWVKHEAAARVRRSPPRDRLLRRVAATFGWGVRMGRTLTGKAFAVEMLAGEDLGYTRFEENRVYINPLPMLRREPQGREVVEGLILHELGHHVYHRGPEAQAIWAGAQDEGLHPLLNLVADEHLERNLRAREAGYGDKLKRLAAYAFQHSRREVYVETLLDGLQARAFAVLTATRLGVARKWGCVSVDSGRILHELERHGLSFARFLRALRMGLGNRHHDPKVAEGLALFRGKFRRSTMPELMACARRLREIFGYETDLLNSLGQEWALDAAESDMLAEGISNADVQSEMGRLLEGRKSTGRSGPGMGGAGLNLGPEEAFNQIQTVQPVPFDPAAHAELARQVARPARQMRRYLEQLGLTLEPERFRLRGRTFDRTRVRDVVLRGEPRMLVARRLLDRTDLFLGVVIDCSGSMGHGESMTKAKLFGALLAEAAREAPGVDLRVFGFTDQVIFDAGTAKRCAVHGLQAGGGNNDAAGLWHAAQAARLSRRRAKLLVMISDGMPTECTVAALRGLVNRLTRRFKMCCAQVAVQPLAEVCFPHYLLLNEADIGASVRRFGDVIARLVRRALSGG
jgi:hypothetical protein